MQVNRGESLQWKPIEVRTVGGSYGRGDGRLGERTSISPSVRRSVCQSDRQRSYSPVAEDVLSETSRTSEAVAVRRSLLYCPHAHAACRALLLFMLLQRPLLPPYLQPPQQLQLFLSDDVITS